MLYYHFEDDRLLFLFIAIIAFGGNLDFYLVIAFLQVLTNPDPAVLPVDPDFCISFDFPVYDGSSGLLYG